MLRKVSESLGSEAGKRSLWRDQVATLGSLYHPGSHSNHFSTGNGCWQIFQHLSLQFSTGQLIFYHCPDLPMSSPFSQVDSHLEGFEGKVKGPVPKSQEQQFSKFKDLWSPSHYKPHLMDACIACEGYFWTPALKFQF